MFDNIGGKIKNLATVICVVGIIASVILAIVLWSQNDRYNPTVALGFGVLIGGCVGSWVGSFFMYGFGELIEETTRNRQINEEIMKKLSQKEKIADESKENMQNQSSHLENLLHQISQQEKSENKFGSRARAWQCAKCLAYNGSALESCHYCGKKKE